MSAFIEFPGYPPHPDCINGCCWYCGSRQRDMPDPGSETGFRLERVFSTHRYLPADDPDEGLIYLGMGKAGVLFICESCLTSAARLLGMVTAPEHADAEAKAAQYDEVEAGYNQAIVEVTAMRERVQEQADRMSEVQSRLADLEVSWAALTKLDAEDKDSVVALRDELDAERRRVAELTVRVENRDAVIRALRSGATPPEVKRGPGRPRKDAAV